MYEGMKMANQGMMAMQQQQEIISNNLANVGTAGYRREVMDVQSFSEVIEQQMKKVGCPDLPGQEKSGFMQVSGGMDMQGMLMTSSRTSFAQGALKNTGNLFDMALDDNGKGFFATKGNDGSVKFTRNGSFKLGTDGYLVSADGSKVLGRKGPIKLEGEDFQVTNEGVVKVGEKEIDRFLVVEFNSNEEVKKYGENNFQAGDTSGFKVSNDFQVKQGFLEMSNVNAVSEMVEMMKTMRAFEANQKLIGTQDQALRKINEVGKV